MTLNIGYFADGPWSHQAFEKINLNENLIIKFITPRYDTQDPILKDYAQKYGIDFVPHQNINSEEFRELVKQYNCDIFVSMSFNQIFKHDIINLPPLKTINCHAGKLPFYRGCNILNWVLINDEKEFGITVHYIDEGIDTGNIITQKCYPITDEDNYGTLLKKAFSYCADLLVDSLNKIDSGQHESIDQTTIHPLGFYCSRRKEGDENIDFSKTSRELFNFVRALASPGPKARAILNGKEIKINAVKEMPNAPQYIDIPGAIAGLSNSGFYLKTKDSIIEVIEFEYDGKIKIGNRLIKKKI